MHRLTDVSSFVLLLLWMLVTLGGCATLRRRSAAVRGTKGATKQAIVALVRATTGFDEQGLRAARATARSPRSDMDGHAVGQSTRCNTQVVYRNRPGARDTPGPIRRSANQEPYKTIASGDRAAMAKLTEEDLFKAVALSGNGLSVDAYFDIVRQWLRTARHPRYNRPYTDLFYAPMIEAMKYLRGAGYKTYIV
jgi:hypothetical protein